MKHFVDNQGIWKVPAHIYYTKLDKMWVSTYLNLMPISHHKLQHSTYVFLLF